jgi:formamidase
VPGLNEQVGNNDPVNDIRDMDLDQNHVLSGPIQTNGAEPGDVLGVDILNMGPFPSPETEWGYTSIFSRQNGGSFLLGLYPGHARSSGGW